MNKATGDMYQGWVTHTWNPLGGHCQNACSYCFVRHLPKPAREGKYSGPLRLDEKAMREHHGKDRTIFVCSCNDLFAESVPHEMIVRVLERCNEFDNHYVFQSKNPNRFIYYQTHFPPETILGTTIESDLWWAAHMGDTPHPIKRGQSMAHMACFHKFITVEPIVQFSDGLAPLLINAKPNWVNIGADSCKSNLPEPSKAQVEQLIQQLAAAGIEVKRKTNLERLLK